MGGDSSCQMCCQSSAGYKHLAAAELGIAYILRGGSRRAMRRGDFYFIDDLQSLEYLARCLHGAEVRFRAHKNRDEWFCHGSQVPRKFAKRGNYLSPTGYARLIALD